MLQNISRVSSKMVRWFVSMVIVSSLSGLSRAAQAQESCPPEFADRPEKCAQYAQRRAQRAARQAERDAADAALRAYRTQHPLRVAALVQSDFFLLGLGNTHVASALGFSTGASLQRYIDPRLLLRLDLLGRFG